MDIFTNPRYSSGGKFLPDEIRESNFKRDFFKELLEKNLGGGDAKDRASDIVDELVAEFKSLSRFGPSGGVNRAEFVRFFKEKKLQHSGVIPPYMWDRLEKAMTEV